MNVTLVTLVTLFGFSLLSAVTRVPGLSPFVTQTSFSSPSGSYIIYFDSFEKSKISYKGLKSKADFLRVTE